MTSTATPRTTLVPAATASPWSAARIVLTPEPAGATALDGGWWPRSYDAAEELPGLLVGLGERFGPIRQFMLNSGAWDGRFHRLAVGPRRVRMGWFTSLDPALAVATTDSGRQIDLLVVPPQTADPAARAALDRAADPGNTMRAADILAAMPAAQGEARTGTADGSRRGPGSQR
jgi:hypothetical protein